MEMEDPSFKKSNTAKEAPKREQVIRDTEELKRAKLLNEIELPRLAKSSTERLPIAALQNIDSEEPIFPKLRNDRVLPN